MAIIKKIIIGFVLLCLLVVVGLYGYIQSLPTGAPEYVNVEELNDKEEGAVFSCAAGSHINVAYDVTVTVTSELNNQPVYDSLLRFKAQLTQANNHIIKGLADDIRINEGDGQRELHPVLFLSKVAADQYAVFTSFNALGLVEKHPMAILSQLIKGLSVGHEQGSYFYPYDAMQRTYRYRHTGDSVERAVYPTTANLEKLLNSFNDYKSNWSVKLGNGCLPLSLLSTEQQAISAAGYEGFIRFNIKATRIGPFADLAKFHYSAYANSGNHWNVKQVAENNISSQVETEEQMWLAINGFDQSKNVALLIQAAHFWLDHYSADDTRNMLLDPQLKDDSKRDFIFALGITGRDDAEAFMLDSLAAMVDADSVDADLQKVRLMVSLSSNDKVSQQSFDAFSALLNNPEESLNVRNNALINMGTTVNALMANGDGSISMQEHLKASITDSIDAGGDQVASAILAAGNAGVDGLESRMLEILATGDNKRRYASGVVLSRDPSYRQLLIDHIEQEASVLVNNAILSNWAVSQLTSAEVEQLQQIGSQSEPEKAKLISDFLTN